MSSKRTPGSSRTNQVVHGLVGSIAGFGLGVYVARQLTAAASVVQVSVAILITAVAATLAYRHGSTFWKALLEAIGDTH